MKPPKRISPSILRIWLRTIKNSINERNYGIAEEYIDKVMERMNEIDWKKLKEIETE